MDAFIFASIVHKGQKRRTGEEYISHLHAVRNILLQAGINEEYILNAALLHDCLEDGNISKEYLAFRFGNPIAKIVDTLSKEDIWRTSYVKAKSNLYALEVAWIHYPEATLIKIADRLHNLRTIEGFPLVKQQEYLQETTYDLLPLFQRIVQEGYAGKFSAPILCLHIALKQEIHIAQKQYSLPR